MNLQREIDSIKNKINGLSDQLDKTNSALTGLNILNILALQKSVNDIGDQLDRLKNFNYKMDSLDSSVSKFNEIMEPMSKLASEKLAYSEIEAKTKHKEVMMTLAKIRSRDERISEWSAYRKLESEQNNNTFELVGSFALGLSIFPIIRLFTKL